MNRKYYVNGNKDAPVHKIDNNLWASIGAARLLDIPLTQLQMRDLPNGQKLELTPIVGPNGFHIDIVEAVERTFKVAFTGRRRHGSKAVARLQRMTKGEKPTGKLLSGTAAIAKFLDSAGIKHPCHNRTIYNAVVTKTGSKWTTVNDNGTTVFVRNEAFKPEVV